MFPRRLVALTLLLCFLALTRRTYAGAENPSTAVNLTETEAFVLQQATLGQVADFGDRQTKNLDSKFLELLLTGQLKGVKISHEGVLIAHAVITGKVALAGAQIAYTTWLNDCEFKKDVDLSGGHVRGNLSLSHSIFDGDTDLGALQVDGYLVLEQATFKGTFDLGGAVIAEDLEGDGVTFTGDNTRTAQFDSIRVANGVWLQDAIFDVPMSLDGADSQFLWMGRNPNLRDTGSSRAGYLNLSHARIHRELHINDMQIGRLLANGLHVEGVADFEKLKIAQEFDFRHAQFKDLILSNIQWPDSGESRQLAGINFDSISPEAEGPANPASTAQSDPQWASLLAWVENSSYAPAAYQQLEAALKREGHSELADGTYESMQKGATSHGSLGRQGQFKNFVSHWLIGYGREPQWAFYWSIPVVLFGWIVFRRREDVESRKGEDTTRPYDPMWYSLDLFLPLTTLQAADVWMPRQDSRFRRYYARVHSILGWILIPIGLAAISGLIAGK